MKKAILSNWSFPRILRLIIGIVILYQAINAEDILIGLAGLFFTGMAVFNMGCCSSGGCYTYVKKDVATSKDITYEEVV
jgi:hypothetical protein